MTGVQTCALPISCVIPYTVRYTRQATEAIYHIPRGVASEVTEAIRALAKHPHPLHAFEVDLEDGLAMKIAGYFITYKMYETQRLIIVVLVEKEDQPET